MRKVLATVVATAALLFAGSANATVTLVFDQTAATTWNLSMTVGAADPAIQALVFQIEGQSADFTIAAGSNIDSFAGFSKKIQTPSLLSLLLQNSDTPVLAGPINPGLLGVLTVTGPFVFIPDTQTGGTVQDFEFNSVPFDLDINPLVPEPGVMILLGLGLAGIGLARRSA